MKTINFSGFQWNVKPTGLAPPPPPPPRGRGPNMWDDGNAQVDDKGYLHLKITAGDPKWHCVELTTRQRLGFGRYQFQVIGRIDKFDPNVVLGLFNYPTPDVGQDGTNEIDIEFAQFRPPLNADYVVLPEIDCLVTLDRSTRALHGPKTEARRDPLFDEAMVRLNGLITRSRPGTSVPVPLGVPREPE
jgi:hypothetical protein